MRCDDFRSLRSVHGTLPLSREVCDTPEHEAWSEHLDDCTSCSDWELTCRVRERGFDPKLFPCVHLADQLTRTCDQHPDPYDCPDALVIRAESGEYGIPVRDGGTSYCVIHYCPWCGATITKPSA
jgi:hypothetical protein